MNGFILNEKGYVTFPYEILKYIEPYVKSLRWKVRCVEHNGSINHDDFPFNEVKDYFLDGEELFSSLQAHSNVQWIWGALSGFPNDFSWEEIMKDSNDYDITMELPYLKEKLCHIECKAIFELIAFDSSETHVLIDDEMAASRLLKHFLDSEILDYDNGRI